MTRDPVSIMPPSLGLGASLRAAPTGNAWLITFVDVVMLLLTFFILLYAMSRPEPARYVPVAQSYIETFKPVPDDEEPATPPRSYVLEPAAG
ncbi:MAG: flagellar motor protein MotB, partial [Rhodospirillaceae bacterium]|nr:flagellar motor protein MotB [Rhodospirillaceae bacterium]